MKNRFHQNFVTYLAEEDKRALQDASSDTPLQNLVSSNGKTNRNAMTCSNQSNCLHCEYTDREEDLIDFNDSDSKNHL